LNEETNQEKDQGKAIRGYGSGGVDAVISVDEVTRQAAAIAEDITIEKLDQLAGNNAFVSIENLNAGYGKMEILHNINLRVGKKQSLCLIGPNGAGKSTILHAIFGFNNIFSGKITIGSGSEQLDVTSLSPNEKLSRAGIAYILQDKSIFPGMTVEENLWMGGFLKDQPTEAKQAAEMIFDKYPRLAARRKHQAKVLSGGERNRLALAKMLLQPFNVLVMDEPTNHLDIVSKDILKNALINYDGTLIVVSHDRDFLTGLTNRTIEFRDKKLKEYLGDIQFFLEKRKLDNMRQVEQKTTSKKEVAVKKELSQAERQEKKAAQRAVQNFERKIEKLEEEIEKFELKMADPSFYEQPDSAKQIEGYKAKKNDLDKIMNQWEEAQMKYDSY